MATKQGLASYQIADESGVVAALDVPFKFDDATATLAQILSWVSGLGASIDTVTDGKITKIRLTLTIPLPGGIKAAAVSGTDVEETALFQMSATGTPNGYGLDVPAFAQSLFSLANVNTGDATVSSFISYLTTPSNSIVGTDRYANALATVLRAKKTFRKRRKALRRA